MKIAREYFTPVTFQKPNDSGMSLPLRVVTSLLELICIFALEEKFFPLWEKKTQVSLVDNNRSFIFFLSRIREIFLYAKHTNERVQQKTESKAIAAGHQVKTDRASSFTGFRHFKRR